MDPENYRQVLSLGFYISVAIVAAMLLQDLTIVAIAVLQCRKSGDILKWSRRVLATFTPWALKLLFILFPIMTREAFEKFPCHDLGEYGHWMIDNVEIQCDIDEHTNNLMNVKESEVMKLMKVVFNLDKMLVVYSSSKSMV